MPPIKNNELENSFRIANLGTSVGRWFKNSATFLYIDSKNPWATSISTIWSNFYSNLTAAFIQISASGKLPSRSNPQPNIDSTIPSSSPQHSARVRRFSIQKISSTADASSIYRSSILFCNNPINRTAVIDEIEFSAGIFGKGWYEIDPSTFRLELMGVIFEILCLATFHDERPNPAILIIRKNKENYFCVF